MSLLPEELVIYMLSLINEFHILNKAMLEKKNLFYLFHQDKQKLFKKAIENGKLDVITLIYNYIDDECINRGFEQAGKKGQLEIIQFLLASSNITMKSIKWSFIGASHDGHLNVVKFLSNLSNDKFDDEINSAFVYACENGHIDVVRFLSTLPYINIYYQSNWAFKVACENGHLEVVKFLSTFHINFAGFNNESFIDAIAGGHLEVVKFLSKLPGIDASFPNNVPVILAYKYGYYEIGRFLQTLPGVNYTPTKETDLTEYNDLT